jgi:hypothetical protein
MSNISPFTPEEIQRAALYQTHVVNEIEQAIVGELEKIEGRIPTNTELADYGRKHIDPKSLTMKFSWKGILLVEAIPMQVDENGQRGTKLVIHQMPDREKE